VIPVRADASSPAAPGTVVQTLAVFPDLAALHAARPERYPFLLESVASGDARACFDILFAFPGHTLALHADGCLHEDGRVPARGDFLAAVDAAWRRERIETVSGADVPFTGGWFVYLGYELAAQIEPAACVHVPDAGLAFPLAQATRVPAAIVRDHARRCVHLVCEAGFGGDYLPALRRDLDTVALAPARVAATAVREDDPERFLDGVRRVQDYIRAGDVFQANLSRQWVAEIAPAARSVHLYRQLCAANPAPFAGLMTLPGDRAVVSSSPERLVSVRGRTISTRPIAGTHPRGADPAIDLERSRALLAHPKERAEHVMLIDLERNDLGRVCRPGSMRVAELMALESYRHVHHIVSEVRGELRDDATPARVIRALFPGGTITGCPKVRGMQIIAELESAARGPYTGSMGYLNRDGSMDLNILIRTVVRAGPRLVLRAGAGIVADSVAERELEETRAKARGVLAALEAV
jgi:4-amino-4-deoxychorismate synthase (2-amino-4-deoxychorismate-forming) component I